MNKIRILNMNDHKIMGEFEDRGKMNNPSPVANGVIIIGFTVYNQITALICSGGSYTHCIIVQICGKFPAA